MAKILIAAIACFYVVCIAHAAPAIEQEEQIINSNGTETDIVQRSKRDLYGYYPYGYGYPYGDAYAYGAAYYIPFNGFNIIPCNPVFSCPIQCPGVCGQWTGYYACRSTGCPAIGDPCNPVNIARGIFLSPFPYDPTRYVQCDTTPGLIYIRSCPMGLVFDPRLSVCNYPSQTPLIGK